MPPLGLCHHWVYATTESSQPSHHRVLSAFPPPSPLSQTLGPLSQPLGPLSQKPGISAKTRNFSQKQGFFSQNRLFPGIFSQNRLFPGIFSQNRVFQQKQGFSAKIVKTVGLAKGVPGSGIPTVRPGMSGHAVYTRTMVFLSTPWALISQKLAVGAVRRQHGDGTGG